MVKSETLKKLAEELPSVELLDSVESDIEARTRSVLALLVGLEIDGDTTPVSLCPTTCPNCDTVVGSTRSPYCGDACREISAFVRQFRAGVEEETIFDPLRQAALGQKLWYVLGGGYPRREPLVPARVILKVIEREGGHCQECGAKATTIDHSGSG